MNWTELLIAGGETLGMTLIGTILAYLVGLPLGILLQATSKKGIYANKWINIPLGLFVNVMRSIPCLILIILLVPINRGIFGTSTGEWYVMIIPLFVASFAFVSRVVETSLNEVNSGVIEVAKSMGASNWQIITKVLLKEAKPALISGCAISAISILGYTAFAYDFSGGGLIALAYAFYLGHPSNLFSSPDLYIIIFVIVVLVQIIQESGLFISKKLDKRRKAN